MPYRVEEYRAAVLNDYKLRKAANGLRHNLLHPTPGNLKDEAIYVCTTRFKRSDEHILIEFFESQKDQCEYVAAINKIDIDYFRPLLYYLRGRTENPDIKHIELLAWLTDFKARPYQHYIIVTPEGGKTVDAPIDLPTPANGTDRGQNGDKGSQQAGREGRRNYNEIEPKPSNQKRWLMAWKNAILILLAFPWVLLTLFSHPIGSVYICDSQGAKRYHLRKNCSGLRNCKHEIITVSLDSAKKTGRTLCHLEGG